MNCKYAYRYFIPITKPCNFLPHGAVLTKSLTVLYHKRYNWIRFHCLHSALSVACGDLLLIYFIHFAVVVHRFQDDEERDAFASGYVARGTLFSVLSDAKYITALKPLYVVLCLTVVLGELLFKHIHPVREKRCHFIFCHNFAKS